MCFDFCFRIVKGEQPLARCGWVESRGREGGVGTPLPASGPYRVLRIDEQLYGCEELPAGQPVLCDVTLTDAAGAARILPYPDRELICLGIDEGDTVCLLPDGTLHKL